MSPTIAADGIADGGEPYTDEEMEHMRCSVCGEVHDRHEDAACGCGCGAEPLECPSCMASGGPRRHNERGNSMCDPDGCAFCETGACHEQEG